MAQDQEQARPSIGYQHGHITMQYGESVVVVKLPEALVKALDGHDEQTRQKLVTLAGAICISANQLITGTIISPAVATRGLTQIVSTMDQFAGVLHNAADDSHRLLIATATGQVRGVQRVPRTPAPA